MPSWVRNRVTLFGDSKTLTEIKNKLETSESSFDFNKIIPAPQELFEVPAGAEEEYVVKLAAARKELGPGWKETSTFHDIIKEMLLQIGCLEERTWDGWADLGDKYLYNTEHFGYSNWYDWCVKNWGTKWNASNVHWDGNDYVEFDTAWSFPEPIFVKLAEMYPEVVISADFAHEDLRGDCGQFESNRSKISINYFNDFEFSCGVWNLDPEEERRTELPF